MEFLHRCPVVLVFVIFFVVLIVYEQGTTHNTKNQDGIEGYHHRRPDDWEPADPEENKPFYTKPQLQENIDVNSEFSKAQNQKGQGEKLANLFTQSDDELEHSKLDKIQRYANIFSFNKTGADFDNFSYLEKVLEDCGELCNTSRPGTPGPYFQHMTAQVNCTALFTNPYIDMSHGLSQAPRHIPDVLKKGFLMNNRVRVTDYYLNNPYMGGNARLPVWEEEDVQQMVELASAGRLSGNYKTRATNSLRDGIAHTPGVKGGRVLVIGSENPWVEACALEAGAREVVTLEYGKIQSKHPQLKTLIPQEFRNGFLNKSLGEFDAVLSYSSLEHSGLGRYGDALNPWGDIITVARAWCVTKPGGGLVIGVMYSKTHNKLAFNAHRYYGDLRYPYLTANWRQVYQGYGIQRVHVFKKQMDKQENTE